MTQTNTQTNTNKQSLGASSMDVASANVGGVTIKDLNRSDYPNYWTFEVTFPKPKHPVLAHMFAGDESEVITKQLSYSKWELRQRVPLIETMTRKHVEETLAAALVVIDRAASLSLEEGWTTEDDEKFDIHNQQHRDLCTSFRHTVQTFVGIWARLKE